MSSIGLYEDELSRTNKNIDDALNGDGKYLGKNVRSNITGEVYHISDKGAMKYFQSPYILSSTMGKNGCPAEYININQDLKSDYFLKENPLLFAGAPMVVTGENQGQSCGAGINVFADQMPDLETKSAGCFTSNEGVLIGSGKTFDQCKTMAANEGYPMFSLNTTENDNGTLYYGNNGTVTGDVYCQGGWGNENYDIQKNMDCLYGIDSRGNKISCSTGGVLMENNGFYCVPRNNEAKPTLAGNCYGFKNTDNSQYYTDTPYTLVTLQLPLDSCTYVNEEWRHNISGIKALTISSNGTYLLINQEGNTLISWKSPLADSVCSYGGGVNLSTLTATYGGNCASQCSVVPGNYTNNVISLINENNTNTDQSRDNYDNLKSPSFYVGTEWKEYYGPNNPNNKIGPAYGTENDPCYGCSKDFVVSYQCGSVSDPVTTNIAASADGAFVNLGGCGNNFTSCITAIGISDDGDVKILRDIYGDPQELFSVSGTYKGKLVSLPYVLAFPVWVAMKNKIIITFNGKKYSMIYGPGEIKKDEFIVSPTATCFFQVTDSLPIIGFYTENLTCNSINGNFTGIETTDFTPSQESLDTQWCVNTRNTYGIIPYKTWGTLSDKDMQNKWNNINCNVLSESTLPPPKSSLFAINQFTNPLFINNYGKQGYVDDEMVLHEYSKELMPSFNETSNSTIVDGTILKSFDYTTDEQCKVECIKNDCNWISINDSSCTLYSDQSGINPLDNGKVFEKIKPAESLSESCPFQDAKSISTSTWEHYVKSETPMTSQTSCKKDNDNYLSKEIIRSNTLYSNINNELVNQNEETNNYLKSHQKNMNDVISNVKNIRIMQDKLDTVEGFSDFSAMQFFDKMHTTTTKMYDETLEIKSYNKNQMLLWTFITFILIGMNYLLIFTMDPPQKVNIIWLVVISILLFIGGIYPLYTIP